MRILISNQTYAGIVMAAISVLVFGALSSRSSASALVERQMTFDPIEIGLDQTAHVVLNNTFGGQEVHFTVNWHDALTGVAIGSPFDANVAPGQGTVAMLPAVQTPVNFLPAPRAILAKVTVSPAPGVGVVPPLIGFQITGNLEVIDTATGHVALARGFATLPAVQ